MYCWSEQLLALHCSAGYSDTEMRLGKSNPFRSTKCMTEDPWQRKTYCALLSLTAAASSLDVHN